MSQLIQEHTTEQEASPEGREMTRVTNFETHTQRERETPLRESAPLVHKAVAVYGVHACSLSRRCEHEHVERREWRDTVWRTN